MRQVLDCGGGGGSGGSGGGDRSVENDSSNEHKALWLREGKVIMTVVTLVMNGVVGIVNGEQRSRIEGGRVVGKKKKDGLQRRGD